MKPTRAKQNNSCNLFWFRITDGLHSINIIVTVVRILFIDPCLSTLNSGMDVRRCKVNEINIIAEMKNQSNWQIKHHEHTKSNEKSITHFQVLRRAFFSSSLLRRFFIFSNSFLLNFHLFFLSFSFSYSLLSKCIFVSTWEQIISLVYQHNSTNDISVRSRWEMLTSFFYLNCIYLSVI